MQVLLLTIVMLLLILGKCLDAVGIGLENNRINSVLFFSVLCISELFPWQLQAGKVSLQPITLLLLLCAAIFFFVHTPQGWMRFKAVLCGCICSAAVYFCSLYFTEYTDEILQEKTVYAALVISACAYVLCSDFAGAMCATSLGCIMGTAALHTAHFQLFFDVLFIGHSPMTLCFLYCMLFIPVLFTATDALQRFVDYTKRVHS